MPVDGSADHEFTMDPNLLVSVIKSQAGSLSKALLEGVMNSIDAGSARVDIELTPERFVITDTGRGFTSEREIREWFGRFGTPHVEGDAVYGRFRMGRGQMFAFARTTWSSGRFRMHVDIEARGLRYELSLLEEPVQGCRVEGELYNPLSDYKLSDTKTELKKSVAYAPRPVYVNGELYGAPARRLKSWTFEDEDAYYKVVQGSTELQVYNQGVFVEDMGTWRTGMGGVVVSKKRLEVNFARNSVLEDRCAVWKRIVSGLERTVLSKLAQSAKLDDNERRFLARRLPQVLLMLGRQALSAKVLTDPTGRHLPLSALRDFNRFVVVSSVTPAACAAHGREGIFVVTEELLTRFGVSTAEDWLSRLSRLPHVELHPGYEVMDARALARLKFGAVESLSADGLSARESAALHALSRINDELSRQLVAAGVLGEQQPRSLLVGRHKKGGFVAWTDGKTYITANRKHLKLFDKGLDGVTEWVNTLVHEYTHDSDDSESHSHGEVFYRKFHDTLFDSGLRLGMLPRLGLVAYLEELSRRGVAVPRQLTRQLRPELKVGRSRLPASPAIGPSSAASTEPPVGELGVGSAATEQGV